MLAVVKCGAISGMLNYNQRGDVLEAQPGTAVGQGGRRRPGLRRSDQGKRRRHRRSRNVGDIGFSAGDPRRVQASRRHRADEQPGHRRGRARQGQGVLHLHVGHHRHAEGQRHDALPVAAGAGRLRRPRDAAQQQRHPVLLPAAVPQQRADGRAVGGAQLGGDAGARQVVLGVEVLGRRDPLRRHRVRLHRRDLRLSAQPAGQGHRSQAQGAGDLRQRAAPGDLGRVHRAVRHRPGVRVLRRQRGKHRVRQRPQHRQVHRHLPDARRVRRVRRRNR